MKKVILLDRDGVINRDSFEYIKSPDELIFIPGSIDAIVRLTKAGYQIAVATNQSGIGRGFYDEDMLAKIHQKIIDNVEAAGGKIALIVHCPHCPNDECLCRKPNPGMLQQIAKKLHITLNGVTFIGDRFSDMQAANVVGAKPILIKSQMTEQFLLTNVSAIPIFDSLSDAVTWFLESSKESLYD